MDPLIQIVSEEADPRICRLSEAFPDEPEKADRVRLDLKNRRYALAGGGASPMVVIYPAPKPTREYVETGELLRVLAWITGAGLIVAGAVSLVLHLLAPVA